MNFIIIILHLKQILLLLGILIFCIKIKNVINITAGKKERTEVRFSQIRETLQINNAVFEIIS